MIKAIKSMALLLAVILLDAVFYQAFISPVIMQWGASAEEAGAALPGDRLAPFASSTRAITIDAPRETVWQWLVQLGGDRGGFYSYTFLENLLGYHNDNAITIVPAFQEMKVGRVVPSTPPTAGGSDKISWPVVGVEPGRSFVLQGWGAFVLREAGPARTRLLVRTHGWDTPTLLSKAEYFFIMPLHYLMERRMLMGIKDRAERGPGAPLSPLGDYLWAAGLFLSAVALMALVFLARGPLGALWALGYSFLWLWAGLVLAPLPVFALALLGLGIAAVFWAWLGKRGGSAGDGLGKRLKL